MPPKYRRRVHIVLDTHSISVKILEKYLHYGPLFRIKLHLLSTVSLSGFRSSLGTFNKALTGKFHGSDGHSKHNSLQNRANFYMSRVWQIVPILTLHFFFSLEGNGQSNSESHRIAN